MADENIYATRALARAFRAVKRDRRPAPKDAPVPSRFCTLRCHLVFAFAIVAFTSSGARAEDPAGIVIGGKASPPPLTVGVGRCVDVEIDGSRAFHCLNEELRRQVDKVAPVLNTPPIDARSPDPQTGVINLPGVREQYGKNFGVSAFPYRPPPPTFTSPILAR
jgi:hypothetical protein